MHAKSSASYSTSVLFLNDSCFRTSVTLALPPMWNRAHWYVPFSVAFFPARWQICAVSTVCCTPGWMAVPKCYDLPTVFSIVTGGMHHRSTFTIAPGMWSFTIGCTRTCTKTWSNTCLRGHERRPHWWCSLCRQFSTNSYWPYRFGSFIRCCLHCFKEPASHLCLFAFAEIRRWEIFLFGQPLRSGTGFSSACTVWSILHDKIVRSTENRCGNILCRYRGAVMALYWMKVGRFSLHGHSMCVWKY